MACRIDNGPNQMTLSGELRTLRVLLIDDDEWIRDSLLSFFQGEACSIAVFETAEEGLTEFRKSMFDIAIVDYRLPGMNGLEFIRAIKGLSPNARTVLMTAYWNAEILKEANSVGIDDFVKKPFTSEAIVASLSTVLCQQLPR